MTLYILIFLNYLKDIVTDVKLIITEVIFLHYKNKSILLLYTNK